MIGTLDIEIQAANPQMPLVPIRAFVNSPTSVRVRNVPKAIGNWKITSVQIVALYPNNATKTANCVLVGGVWVGTIEGCDRAGKVESGFTVYASGIDENENPVSNYVLGKGLVEILDGEGTIDPSDNSNYVHLFDAEPSTPKTGDFYPTTSGYAIWQDGEAHVVDAGATSLAQDAYDLASSVAASASEINVVATSALTLASSAYSLASDGNELAANAYSLASSGYDLASSAYGLASEIGGQLNLTNASVSSNTNRIGTIEEVVPSGASSNNQLADKLWVGDKVDSLETRIESGSVVANTANKATDALELVDSLASQPSTRVIIDEHGNAVVQKYVQSGWYVDHVEVSIGSGEYTTTTDYWCTVDVQTNTDGLTFNLRAQDYSRTLPVKTFSQTSTDQTITEQIFNGSIYWKPSETGNNNTFLKIYCVYSSSPMWVNVSRLVPDEGTQSGLKASQITPDGTFVTSEEVKPNHYMSGLAQGATESYYWFGIKSANVADRTTYAYIEGSTGKVRKIKNYYNSWYLTKYNGTTLDTPIELKWGYYETTTFYYRKLQTITLNSWAWVATTLYPNTGTTRNRFYIKAECDDDGYITSIDDKFYVNATAHDITYSSDQKSIATFDGSADLVECTRESALRRAESKYFVLEDDLSSYATQAWTTTQLATKQDALTQAQLDAVNSGITASKVAQYDNAASNLNYAILSLSPTSITATIPAGMFPIKVTIGGTTYTANTAGIETVDIVPQSNGYWLVSYFGGDSNLAGYFNLDGTFDQIGPDVQDLTFGTDDHIPTSSDTLNLNYTYTLQDRAVNLFDLIPTVTKCYLTFPSSVAGHACDFLICATTHAGTYANPPEMLIDEETGIIINNGGTIPELATSSSQQSTTIVRFSEIYEDGFAVSQPITNTQLSEITTKLNYELSTLTPTNGDPYILASMLPIAVTIQGTTTTITDPSEVYMDKLGTEPNQVYDLLWTNGTSIFITLATCRANGIYIGHGNDVDTITFGGNTPVADTTQILGFKKNYILDDRTINTISVSPLSYICDLTFPSSISNHARDFSVRVVADAGTYATLPTLAISGVTLMNANGQMPTIATDTSEAKTTLIHFSEIAANTFLVNSESLQTIAS